MKPFYLILTLIPALLIGRTVSAQISVDEVDAGEESVTFQDKLKSIPVDVDYFSRARYKAERAAIRKERNYLEFNSGVQGALTSYNDPWISVSGGDNSIALTAVIGLRHVFTKNLFTIETKFSAKLGYNHTVAQLDNLALNMDDLDFSLKDIRYTEDTYSLGLFHRSYVGLDAGRRFGLFNETTLSFNTGTTRFSRGTENAEAAATDSENAFKSTETTLYELHLGINPGVAVFIMQNVSAEVSFGVIGFKYSSETQKNNLGETGKRHNSGANFKINLFNINIGITLCL